MKYTGFIDKTLLLEAGNEYDLEILRIIDIPGDKRYFLGRDGNGLKHLIPVDYYTDYGITPGDTVSCRLDKINCQGRFYFEPEHPVYKCNTTYYFELIEVFSDNSNSHNGITRARVRDIFGREWKTAKFKSRSSFPGDISSLLCLVVALKKARLFLRVLDPRVLS